MMRLEQEKYNFINIRDYKPARSPATEAIIDQWEHRMSLLRDLADCPSGYEGRSGLLQLCQSSIKLLNEEVLMEQVVIRRAKEQLKLMKEARDELLKEIQELSMVAEN